MHSAPSAVLSLVVRACAAAASASDAGAGAAAPEPPQGDRKTASEVSAAVAPPAAAAAAPRRDVSTTTTSAAAATATAATASLALKAEQLVASARGAEAALQALAASGEECSGALQDLRVGQAAAHADIAGLQEQLGAVQQELGGVRTELGGVREELGGVREELGGVREELAAARKAAAEEARSSRLQRARLALMQEPLWGSAKDKWWCFEMGRVLGRAMRGDTKFLVDVRRSSPNGWAAQLMSMTGLEFCVEGRGEGDCCYWMVLVAE
ncbi:hypothetical protein HYH02_006821 [Chlamydomonas schloesseri]|uniref:Uncharacterized protein n=1 Tax=Chlamydomonas schloesseri TaxID=2026947 RepID=A0A836B5G8_9CHLO|nr:hypothetical protein HYH02_006821 [Chlamydomonas schloesseri]|eukprot:KAG2448236.1 hypothetical protein HYH02_006821 [Chlamydomonas schloesseri]